MKLFWIVALAFICSSLQAEIVIEREPEIISDITFPATIAGNSNAQVVVNNSGIAVSVWEHDNEDGTFTTSKIIEASVFRDGNWTETERIGVGIRPQVDIDNAGNAIAIWSNQSTTDTLSDIFVSRYTFADDTWTPPFESETDTNDISRDTLANGLSIARGTNLILPQIAINRVSGNAIAVWVGNLATGTATSGIFAKDFSSTTGWNPNNGVLISPQFVLVSSDFDSEERIIRSSTLPQIAFDFTNDIATVVWQSNIDGNRVQIFSAQISGS